MRLALLIVLLFSSNAARAELVTTAVAAAAFFFGVSAATVYLVAATVLLSTGMAIYGSAQARRAERDARNAANAAMQDRMVTRIASESPHRYVYGRARVGSDIVAMFTSGDKDQFKHIVCVLAAHECDAVEEVYINNVAVGLLAGNGDVTAGRYAVIPGAEVMEEAHYGPGFDLGRFPITGTVRVFGGFGADLYDVASTVSGRHVTVGPITGKLTVAYQYQPVKRFDDAVDVTAPATTIPYVRVQIHLGGASDTADAYLMSQVGGKWPSTAVLRGLCYLVVSLDLNNPEFQNGQVPIQALVRGRKLYDPRTGQTAWSMNPSLAVRDYLTSPLCGVPASDLPDAQFITAANVCDELVVNGAARYTINGTATSDQDQAHVLESMAQCMAGGIVSTSWDISAGKYVAPVLALDQSDIVGGLSITPGVSDAAIYNGVKGQYLSGENDYVLTDFKPFQNDAYRTADGRDLYTNIDFPFTNTLQRVTNLARIFTEDMRNGFTLKAEFSLKAWPLKVGQRITFTSAFFGQAAKVYRVTDKAYSPNSAVELTLKEDDASIWDFADAVVLDSTPNTNLPDPWEIAPLASLSCTSGVGTLLRQPDGTIIPRILVSWPVVSTQAVFTNGEIEIEWRAIGTDTWQKTKATGDVTEAYLSPITQGWVYVVRARTVNPYLNTRSDWAYATYRVAVVSATPSVFQWAPDMPAAPTGAAAYNWSNDTYGTAPAGWSLTEPAPPAGINSTLWIATVYVSDIDASGSTGFLWQSASVVSIGFVSAATQGPTGPEGSRYASADLYQWSTVAPAAPTGTSTFTWATAVNSAYTASDGWSLVVPANPGTPGIRLYQAKKPFGAAASALTTTVSYASASIAAIALNGANGPTGSPGTPGIKAAPAAAYRWGNGPAPTAAGTATFTWASASYNTPPSGWSITEPAAPGQGYTLYKAVVNLVDTAGAATTGIDWTTANIVGIGYMGLNGTGGAGSPGNSSVIAYTIVDGLTLNTTPDTITVTGTGLPAIGAWGSTRAWTTVPGIPTAGQSLHQSNGTYNSTSTVYGLPYMSTFRVGQLSALSSNLGTITAGSISINGQASIDVNGAAIFKAIQIQAADGTPILTSGAALNPAYAAAGTKNSDFKDGTLVVGGDNLCYNSSFEFNNGVGSYGWNVYNNAPEPDPAPSIGTGRTGGSAQVITWTGNHTTTKGITGAVCKGGWQPNITYVVSFWAKTTNLSTAVGMFLGWNINPATTTNLLNPSVSTIWQRYAIQITWGSSVEPNGTAYISIGTGTGSGNVWFDDVMVVEGSVLPAYYTSAAEAATLATWAGTTGTGKPADNATVGAPAGTNVGTTPATTVESNAATAYNNSVTNAANLQNKLTKNGTDILSGQISLQSQYAFVVGTVNDGLFMGSLGLVGRKGGITTFVLGNDGGATFAGNLQAASGTLGDLHIPTGGALHGGAYTGSYAWPASGTGFHLSARGLLLGNYNSGNYFEVNQYGDISSTYLTISGSIARFSGTLSASKVVTTDNLADDAVSGVDVFSSIGDINNQTPFSVPSNSKTLIMASIFAGSGSEGYRLTKFNGSYWDDVGGYAGINTNSTSVYQLPAGTYRIYCTGSNSGNVQNITILKIKK